MNNFNLVLGASIAFTLTIGHSIQACDTWVALPDVTASGVTILAKNSDRPTFDCQPLLMHPRQQWEKGATINTGRVTIPQVDETYATIGSSPYWCWGYEEGMNEHGVAIGNEGIATKALAQDLEALANGEGPDLGLTGMDLLRLGLERGQTARGALDVITALLEEHGQFGSGLPAMEAADGAYHNSYIIADPNEAWVLETAGRRWVAKRLRDGSTSISNTPSIGAQWDLASSDLVSHAQSMGWWPKRTVDKFDFTLAYGDTGPRAIQQRAMSLPRAVCSSGLLQDRAGAIDPRWMMRIARDESSSPPINLDRTASSCVAVLPKSDDDLPVFWWAPSVPGDSCYVPFFVHGGELPEIVSAAGTQGRAVRPPIGVAPDSFADESYWWIFRDLHDLASGGAVNRTPEVRATFDALEREFEQGLPVIIEKAVALRNSGRFNEASQTLDAYTEACLERTIAKAYELRSTMTEENEGAVPSQFAPYLGVYNTTHKRESHTVKMQGGRLAIDTSNQRVFELLDPDESGRRQFAITDQVSVSFMHDEAGDVIGMVYHQGGMNLECWRDGYEFPAEVTAQGVQALLGDYRFAQANLDAKVFVDRGRLAVDVPGQMIFVLRQGEAESEWVSRATDQIRMTFQMDAEGVVSTMTIMQAAQPVVFERLAGDN